MTLDDYQKSSYVSVMPNSFVNVSKYPDNDPVFISAEGSWIEKDGFTKHPFGIELQTSKIECNKTKNVCYEAIARANGKYMYVDLREHEILDWKSNSVKFGIELQCLNELNTIDVTTKSVSRVLEYKHIANCDTSTKDEYFHMGKGFDVYMKEKNGLDSLLVKFIKFIFNVKDHD